jgi:hypothetical protein
MTLLNYTDPIPLPAPLTSGTTIQSYTDPLGDVWVAKNGVNGGAWKRAQNVLHSVVYRNAAFNMATANTALSFDTVLRDPYGLWVSPFFTAPIPGLFRLMGQVAASATASGQWINVIVGPGASGVGTIMSSIAVTMIAKAESEVIYTAGAQNQVLAGALSTYAGVPGNGYTYAQFDYMGTG